MIHFSRFMQSSFVCPFEALFNLNGPSVSVEQNLILSVVPSADEIHDAVFHLKRNSSPGPDRFSGIFFTSCRHVVGQDVISAVTHFFSTSKLLRVTNAYFLTLIPKKQSPVSFDDFRPISLVNFSYKIISEILAKRFSDILPLLISKHHAAFVRGEIHSSSHCSCTQSMPEVEIKS